MATEIDAIVNAANVVVDPLETIDYTIKVISQKGNEKLIQGTYDKKGLPDEKGNDSFKGLPGEGL